jgi:ABC-2 type transport system permease protein
MSTTTAAVVRSATSRRRIMAVFKRHFYVTIYSVPRMFDWLFWPVIDLMLWGFVTTFLAEQNVALPTPVGFLIGGVLLWDLVFRSKNGIALAFLEESWSRNVINILASPITPTEYVAGAMLWGLARMAMGWATIVVLASALFAFHVWHLGPVLALMAAALLVFGVSLSMIVLGLALRFGNQANILAWAISFMIMPFSAVFYPVSILPGWAQAVASVLPTAHIFEAMRTVLASKPTPRGHLEAAAVLDAVFLIVGFAYARAMFATLRRRGYVTRYM